MTEERDKRAVSTRGAVRRRAGSIRGMQALVTAGHTPAKNLKRSATVRAKHMKVTLAPLYRTGDGATHATLQAATAHAGEVFRKRGVVLEVAEYRDGGNPARGEVEE